MNKFEFNPITGDFDMVNESEDIMPFFGFTDKLPLPENKVIYDISAKKFVIVKSKTKYDEWDGSDKYNILYNSVGLTQALQYRALPNRLFKCNDEVYYTNDDNVLKKISEHDCKDVVTTQDIIIETQTPLGEAVNLKYWPGEWFNSENMPFIPAGQTLESILKELFVKTLDGSAVWEIGDLKFNRRDSQFTYTPIIECGGTWSLISDQSATLEEITIPATLSSSYGYFLSPESQWCNDTLTVNVPVVIWRKTIVYKSNGSSMTRDAGHWVNYPMPDIQGNEFGMALAISEENTYSFSVESAVYHPAVYASNNKKRIQKNIAALLDNNSIPVEKLGSVTKTKTKKIHNSYYYFAGVVQDNIEAILSGDLKLLPIKDFVHKYDEDTDSVYLPHQIVLPEMTIPPGQTGVLVIPPPCGCSFVGDTDELYYDRIALPYILPDGTEVEYMCISLKNNTETPHVVQFSIGNPS